MRRGLIIASGAILVVIIGTGVAWYKFQASTFIIDDDTPVVPRGIQLQSESTAPVHAQGTIDSASLVSTSKTPTITGTFGNIGSNGSLELLIVQGNETLPGIDYPGDDLITKVIWADGNGTSGHMSVVPIGSSSGSFSDTILPQYDLGLARTGGLSAGTYTIGLYAFSVPDGAFHADAPGALISTATLIIK